MTDLPDQASGVKNTRRNTTAEEIKHLILARGLRPGDAIPTETELCQVLGVSRTSVREAVRSLATLDIVEVRHGLGTVVGQMSLAPLVETLVFRGVLSPGDDLAALREVVDMRCNLDLAMSEQVVAAHKGRENKVIEDLVARMMERAEAEQPFLAEDRRFHNELLMPVGNQLAVQMVTAFWDIHTAVLPKLDLALPADLRQTANAHGDLYRSALEGDSEAYRRAVIDHYEPLMRMLRRKVAA